MHLEGPFVLIIKPRSFFHLKYDIIAGKKIGRLRIPFTRLIPSLRFGDIGLNIHDDEFYIVVHLKGTQRIGFLPSEYHLMKDDTELSWARFPARGSNDPFQISWNDQHITFSDNGDNVQVYLDGDLLGRFYSNYGQKKVVAVDINEKLPIEIQVFSYFAYKKYTEVSLGL